MQVSLDDIQELRFTVVRGGIPGSKVTFKPTARSIRVGRALDNDVVISDPSVSRSHVRVDVRSDGYFIADAGSTAGVEKMGFRVGGEPEPLESGDEFKIGDTILRFEVVVKKGALKKAPELEPGKKKIATPRLGEVAAVFQRPLAMRGLRTRTSQLLAVGCLGVLLVLLLLPSAPGLPPQAPQAPLPINYNAVIGFFPNADDAHLDGAIFEMPSDAEGLCIHFTLQSSSPVELRTGGQTVAKIEPTNDWRTYQLFVVPRALASAGGPRLVFDYLGYSASDGDRDPVTVGKWGVARMWVARVPRVPSSPALLAQEARALSELSGRLEDDLGNLYTLVKNLAAMTIGLMKLGGRPALLASSSASGGLAGEPIAELLVSAQEEIEAGRLDRALDRLLPAVRQADVDLSREYQRFTNNLALAQRKGPSGTEQARLLATIARLIPEPTDPRNRAAHEEVGKLVGKDLEVYKELLAQQ